MVGVCCCWETQVWGFQSCPLWEARPQNLTRGIFGDNEAIAKPLEDQKSHFGLWNPKKVNSESAAVYLLDKAALASYRQIDKKAIIRGVASSMQCIEDSKNLKRMDGQSLVIAVVLRRRAISLNSLKNKSIDL